MGGCAVFNAVMDHMFGTVVTNYVSLWAGDWGMINQWYIVIYSFVLLPMMWYLVYNLIRGLIKQSKTGKKSSKFN